MQPKHIIGGFEGFFHGDKTFLTPQIVLSASTSNFGLKKVEARKTSGNRRLCVFPPVYKKQHHKLLESAVRWYIYVPVRPYALHFYRCLSFYDHF